jgi:hypothetical protein
VLLLYVQSLLVQRFSSFSSAMLDWAIFGASSVNRGLRLFEGLLESKVGSRFDVVADEAES